MNKFYATVTVPKGRSFPIDMLRYDSCWPIEEGHALAIEECFDDLYGFMEETQIHLCKWHDEDPANWQNVWAIDRWRSKFVCKLTPLQCPT